MATLEELYNVKRTLEEVGAPVPVELLRKIAKIEGETLAEVGRMALSLMPANIASEGLSGNFTVMVEYRDNILYGACVHPGFSMDESAPGFVLAPGPKAPGAARKDIKKPRPKKAKKKSTAKGSPKAKAKSKGFSVRFADGTVIDGPTAADVMISALRKMGLEAASQYRGLLFQGDPMVGTRQFWSKDGTAYRKEVDGWFVHTTLDNETKKKYLKRIADYLGHEIEIISPEAPSEGDKNTGKTAPQTAPPKFTFNGSGPLSKGRAVLAAITQLLSDEPGTTYERLLALFPRKMVSNYGVIASLSEIDSHAATVKDIEKRYFLKDTLQSADGVKFAVTTQWDYNNFPQVQEVIRNLGYALDEVVAPE